MTDQPSLHVATGDHDHIEARPRLQYFPISFFASVLGMTGATIALQRAERFLGLPFAISGIVLVASLAIFLVVATFYTLKAIRYPEAVKREFAHPVKINFFPTISISMLLFGIAFMRLNSDVSRLFWMAGAALHIGFTIAILSAWMQRTTLQPQHANPAWFIPVVGNIIVPIAGVEHAPAEVSWFFFSIGLIFWLVLLTIVLYRIIFYPPLAERLRPTLFILIAPPAVGFISYLRLMEHDVSGFTLDSFARVMYYVALFIFILLLTQARYFVTLPFYLSWWAYSFPVAAIAIATIVMASRTNLPVFQGLAYGLLIGLGALIIVLLFRTVMAIVQRKICIEDE
ncbi:MAG: SLAC1 anion channel family protein [Oscillochloridaceae bacterium]|nr:SLAC1 anion channel family protein [Chloroflexaceae bacterium]MDW8389787.1 SLAC1 anion channel family protein [Oscillochloridaceae bacterium]